MQQVEYTGSYPTYELCPDTKLAEYAFIGRSNVGKSSLINMLCNRKQMARVSNTPGKTQTLNFFLINGGWYLVDLPGLGYAKVSKTTRRAWGEAINKYTKKRPNLQSLFMLIDIRIPPQKIDLDFIEFLGVNRIPFALVFTKSDKVKPAQINELVGAFVDELQESWESLPPHFVTSAKKRNGRAELLAYIEKINGSFEPTFPG